MEESRMERKEGALQKEITRLEKNITSLETTTTELLKQLTPILLPTPPKEVCIKDDDEKLISLSPMAVKIRHLNTYTEAIITTLENEIIQKLEI